eukprot:gb/GECG01009338.1/.p1 GENE.gb/GECG01009338.1/~~gb/GECG01009338.1/.p1  ORF type:complete len:324 (+),score=40.20 gb/GECG01009338.1/:1-972(+)
MTSFIELRDAIEVAGSNADDIVVDYIVEALVETQERAKAELLTRQQVFDEILNVTMFLEDVDDRDKLANDILHRMLGSELQEDCLEDTLSSKETVFRSPGHKPDDGIPQTSITAPSTNATPVSSREIPAPVSNTVNQVAPVLTTGFPRVDPATGKTVVNDIIQAPAVSKKELKEKKKQQRAERAAKKSSHSYHGNTSSDSDTAPALASTKEGHHTISVSAKEMERAALLDAEVMSSKDGRMGIVEDENGGITEGVVAGAWRGEVHGAASGDSKEVSYLFIRKNQLAILVLLILYSAIVDRRCCTVRILEQMLPHSDLYILNII